MQHCADRQSVCTCSEWAAHHSKGRTGKPCRGSQALGKADQWGAAAELFQSQFYVVYTYVYKNTESLDPQVYNPFQLVIASSQIICSVSA